MYKDKEKQQKTVLKLQNRMLFLSQDCLIIPKRYELQKLQVTGHQSNL